LNCKFVDYNQQKLKDITSLIIIKFIVSLICNIKYTCKITHKSIQNIKQIKSLEELKDAVIFKEVLLNYLTYIISPILICTYMDYYKIIDPNITYTLSELKKKKDWTVVTSDDIMNRTILNNILSKNDLFHSGGYYYTKEKIEETITKLKECEDYGNCDQDTINSFIQYLQNPVIQDQLIQNKITIPEEYNLLIKDSSNNTYISTRIFNELMGTTLGNTIMGFFTNQNPAELADKLRDTWYKSNDITTIQDKLGGDNNSLGLLNGDIALFTVIQCLDTIRHIQKENKQQYCKESPSNLTINLNTPVVSASIDKTI